MRIIAALGLFLLALLNAFGFYMSITNGDWKGLALMLFMAALLFFFARTLWRGALLERGLAQGRLTEGWEGEPLGTFFTAVVARTIEGWIFMAGTLACALVALLGLLWPAVLGMDAAGGKGAAVLFGMWPVLAFVIYVRICGPRYETTFFTIAFTLATAGFPFYYLLLRNAR